MVLDFSTWASRKSLEESKAILGQLTALLSTLMGRGKSPRFFWVFSFTKTGTKSVRIFTPFFSASSYSSGGEDGYVRIHYFDPQYFEFEFEA